MRDSAGRPLEPAPAVDAGEVSAATRSAPRRSRPHDSAVGHVTGLADYVPDLPRLEGELVVDYVPSPVANGRLVAIDVAEARRLPGVVGVWTFRDIPGQNEFGPVFEDEPFLPAERVSYVGQPLAVIAAESKGAAQRARRAVKPVIEEEEPVLTVEAAEERGLFIGPERRIENGDLEAGWAAARHRIEGVFRSAGQEQLYFESQASLVWRSEGEIRVHSSTQNPTEIQKTVADMLGIGQYRVVCEVRRLGGGFGGKETQAALPALMAALVVWHTGRPARMVYDRDDDMITTGKRHAFRTRYRAGFDDEGRITAIEVELRSNGGAFADLSTAVLERAMLHVDNAYHLPAVSIGARVCRTNLPPSTAFRGFGGPQGMAVIENVVQEIAATLDRDALDVRRVNLYDANLAAAPEEDRGQFTHLLPEDRGQFTDLSEETALQPRGSAAPSRSRTPYGQIVRDNLVPEIFDRLERSTGYRDRLSRIEAFNRDSTTELRGLAITPVKFGISFTTKFLNQANALVNVFTDGTVQLSTGATEMGQGVNVKLAEIVADELGIDPDSVVVMPTSTEKNNNTSPTAASASTDLNGAAAVVACREIRNRLAECAAVRFARESGLDAAPQEVLFEQGEVWDRRAPERRLSFGELCDHARRERVDLGARGFYKTPDIDFDRETGRGTPFYYFTAGAAMAQVRLDRLSGELVVESLHALMDIGRVLNHGVELGQAIGGLLQGVGWVTTEELVYDDGGRLLSTSPTTYKIPNVSDLPEDFSVEFLDNDLNRHNLRSTKAVGEPPLMLGLSVWAAIKHALSFVAPGRLPDLQIPATGEQILLCVTELERAARPTPATPR